MPENWDTNELNAAARFDCFCYLTAKNVTGGLVLKISKGSLMLLPRLVLKVDK